jgi:hypothetical protein
VGWGENRMENIEECIKNEAEFSKMEGKHPYCSLKAELCEYASDAYIQLKNKKDMFPVCRLELDYIKGERKSNKFNKKYSISE